MKNLKVPFGYIDGEIVDVTFAEKGKDYTCSCGGRLRLRGGDIVTDHFYHVGEGCSYESAIHKAYKAVFQSLKKVLLPGDPGSSLSLPWEMGTSKVLEFDRVELEKKIGDFIPDAIGYIGDTPYFIEFANTSFIGKKKLRKIREANVFCLEISINLSMCTVDQIAAHLSQFAWYKKIIHIPQYAPLTAAIERVKTAESRANTLISENKELRWKLRTLESTRSINEDLFTGDQGINTRLFFATHCKNGAKMYSRNNGDGSKIIAFAKGNVLDIKTEL